jgi:hypothetical protein
MMKQLCADKEFYTDVSWQVEIARTQNQIHDYDSGIHICALASSLLKETYTEDICPNKYRRKIMNIIERNHSKARISNTKSPGDRKQMETLPGEDTADTVLPKRSEPARNRKKYKESTRTSVQAYRNQVTQGLEAPCITSELLEQQTRLLTVLTRIEVDGIQGRHVIANT